MNTTVKPTQNTFQIYLEKLFPICRSITGNGNRETLKILNEISSINIKEIPSGTKIYDWTIPDEWNINDAWIKGSNGQKLIDFKNNNLHVINYSSPVKKELTWAEIKRHLNTHEELDNAIPYLTSYYETNWGFCLTKRQYNDIKKQKDGKFSVLIDSDIKSGSLTYGECIIPGKSKKEIIISCYICHPSMANDCISGFLITAFLAEHIKSEIDNYWSYRIVFVPETIGSIAYCKINEKMIEDIDIGIVVTTAGGPGKFGYKQSWDRTNYLNGLCEDIFREEGIDYIIYPFDAHGSDERQYSSPGFRINTVTITKDKYYEYEQYHTSLDNLDFVNGKQIFNSFKLYCRLIEKIESQKIYVNKFNKGEVMLSKHGLYNKQGGSVIPIKESLNYLDIILWVLFYCDGKLTIEEIQKKLKIKKKTMDYICSELESRDILKRL